MWNIYCIVCCNFFDWNKNAINGKRRDKSYGFDINDRKLSYVKEYTVLRLIGKVIGTGTLLELIILVYNFRNVNRETKLRNTAGGIIGI